MVGLLLVTHTGLGEVLIDCVSHVLNRRPVGLTSFALAPQDEPSHLLPEVRTRVQALDDGDGVLVLTDLYGATPANLAMKLLEPGHVEGLAGVNLPMLLRVLTYREHCDLGGLLERAVTGACDGVVRMKPL